MDWSKEILTVYNNNTLWGLKITYRENENTEQWHKSQEGIDSWRWNVLRSSHDREGRFFFWAVPGSRIDFQMATGKEFCCF